LTLVAFMAYAKTRNPQFPASKNLLSISLLVLIMITGHLGGSLTHGSDYLTKPLFNIFSGDSTVSLIIKPVPNVQEAQVYTDVIKPILQTRCYSCHGANKQKGGLRMDDSMRLLKGGKDGIVIEAGSAEKSELVKRLALSLGDDDHMPPKEKPQLTKAQIALLHWWIDNGAVFNKKVKDIEQPAEVKQFLSALQSPQHKTAEISAIPDVVVEKADEGAITKLKAAGALVLPVAQISNYLMVSFITDTVVSANALHLMKQLNKQIIWLKLANTNISDAAMQFIGQLTHLTRLDLSNTNITDAGVKKLAPLSNLQYLNLVNTKVTDAGIAPLKGIKTLRELFLYKTSINQSGYINLKKLFPKTMIDTGGYTVPTLPTDTAVVKEKKVYQ
jgi:mono/diheme cytochrome c family protein